MTGQEQGLYQQRRGVLVNSTVCRRRVNLNYANSPHNDTFLYYSQRSPGAVKSMS